MARPLPFALLVAAAGQWSALNTPNQQAGTGFQFHQYGLDARTVDSATRLAATKVFLANVSSTRLARGAGFALARAAPKYI